MHLQLTDCNFGDKRGAQSGESRIV